MTLHALSISSNIDARLSMKAFKCRQKQQQQQQQKRLFKAYIHIIKSQNLGSDLSRFNGVYGVLICEHRKILRILILHYVEHS